MQSHSLYSAFNSTVKLVWIYGPSGSGKTHYARVHYPKAFPKPSNSDFAHYENQDTILITDLALNARRSFILNLVKWLDPQPFPVTCRYKKTYIRPKRIVICSYNHPLDFKHLKPFMPKFLSNCRIVYCGNKSHDKRQRSSSEESSTGSSSEDLLSEEFSTPEDLSPIV